MNEFKKKVKENKNTPLNTLPYLRVGERNFL